MKLPLPITKDRKSRGSPVRYQVQLPVIFNWQENGQRSGVGFTKDVSLTGAFILSTVSPPVGSEIAIEVLVPSPDGKQLKVQCSGKVSLVLRRTGGYSFTVKGLFNDQISDHDEL